MSKTRKEIIDEILEKYDGKTMPDLSDPVQYKESSLRLSEKTRPKIDAIDRLLIESKAKAFIRIFG